MTWTEMFKKFTATKIAKKKYKQTFSIVKSATFNTKKLLDKIDEYGYLYNSLIKVY